MEVYTENVSVTFTTNEVSRDDRMKARGLDQSTHLPNRQYQLFLLIIVLCIVL